MRTQRRARVVVQLVRTNVVEDQFGNSAETPRNETVHKCQFYPSPPAERSGDDSARILQTGFWDLPGDHPLLADDLIKAGGVTWQVVGGSTLWLDRTKVPVQQARAR
ncbi:MAG TPA: hypothetical protein VFE15_15540 [Marmoricola sp.]|nr:hypothetical protein [Marmoricola sp.]